jgi:hypothetical protein
MQVKPFYVVLADMGRPYCGEPLYGNGPTVQCERKLGHLGHHLWAKRLPNGDVRRVQWPEPEICQCHICRKHLDWANEGTN